jgi:S1/P1 Nuclease
MGLSSISRSFLIWHWIDYILFGIKTPELSEDAVISTHKLKNSYSYSYLDLKAVSAQFPLPEGDRGGTRFYIRATADRSTISLHKFWDDLILGSERFQSVQNQAIALRNNSDYQRDRLPELSETAFDRWARVESFKIAPQVYKDLQSGSKDDGKALPDGYANTAKPNGLPSATAIAERRMMLAGYRLADYLKAAF